MKKITYEENSKEEQKKKLILLAHKNIMHCGECNEGFMQNNKGDMEWCGCIKNEFRELEYLKDVEISIKDDEYELWVKESVNPFYKEWANKLCVECQTLFKTNLKGRVRCEKCYKEYLKEFREVGNILKDIKETK